MLLLVALWVPILHVSRRSAALRINGVYFKIPCCFRIQDRKLVAESGTSSGLGEEQWDRVYKTPQWGMAGLSHTASSVVYDLCQHRHE